MGSMFDHLQDELNKREAEEKKGISPLDLADLPKPLRRMMRVMLRETRLTYKELIALQASQPEAQRLEKSELDQSLDALVNQNWLIRFGEGENATYKVNLSRKRGSSLGEDFWSGINQKLEERIRQAQPKNKDAE